MKKLILFVLVTALCTSCNKKSTTVTPANASIVGKWTYKSGYERVYSSAGTLIDDEAINFPADAYEQYNADGTALVDGGGGDEVLLSYTVKGNTLTTYETPKYAGEKPQVITISVAAGQLTEHSVIIAHGDSTIEYDVLIR